MNQFAIKTVLDMIQYGYDDTIAIIKEQPNLDSFHNAIGPGIVFSKKKKEKKYTISTAIRLSPHIT